MNREVEDHWPASTHILRVWSCCEVMTTEVRCFTIWFLRESETEKASLTLTGQRESLYRDTSSLYFSHNWLRSPASVQLPLSNTRRAREMWDKNICLFAYEDYSIEASFVTSRERLELHTFERKDSKSSLYRIEITITLLTFPDQFFFLLRFNLNFFFVSTRRCTILEISQLRAEMQWQWVMIRDFGLVFNWIFNLQSAFWH